MTITVPLYFNPASEDYVSHLEFEAADSGCRITWPIIGASIIVDDCDYPKIELLENMNPGHFKSFGFSGFSLGNYHEFLINLPTQFMYPAVEQYACFQMGGAEATFGQATPLAAALFNSIHQDKYHGEWQYIHSLRLYNVPFDAGEAGFINACMHYEANFGGCPTLSQVFSISMPEDESHADPKEIPLFLTAPIVDELDPIRFYYNGISSIDDSAACVSYFRVLEYYSSLTMLADLRKYRGDHALSDWHFFQKIIEMIAKDDKSSLFRLIDNIGRGDPLRQASDLGLVKTQDVSLLANEIYIFRNSIVHGKYSYGYSLHSSSPLCDNNLSKKWRSILRSLAKIALDRFGKKLI